MKDPLNRSNLYPDLRSHFPLSHLSLDFGLQKSSSCGHYQFPPKKNPVADGLLLLSPKSLVKTFSLADPERSGSTATKLSIGLKDIKTKLVRLPSQHFLVAFGVQLLSSGIIGKFSGFFVCFSMFQCTFTDCHDARMHF